MNNSEFYAEYLRQIAEQEAQQRAANDPFASAKNAAAKIGSYGDNLSTVGNAINKYINNPTAQTIGTKMSALGGNLTNGANAVTNTLNTPQNYFKGVANRAVGTGLQNAGNYLAQKAGLANTLGTGMQNLGASMLGNTAATGAGAAAAGTTAGTAAGAGAAGTAAGTGAAAGGAAAGGSAAGGAAAGGSAAGGAAFSNPITAIIALAAMAAMGANRKRAKKGGQALLNSTNQMASEEADNALAQTQQNAANLQLQAQQALNGGVVTGGASPVQQQLAANNIGYNIPQNYGQNSIIENAINQSVLGNNTNGVLGNNIAPNTINQNVTPTPEQAATAAPATNALAGGVSQEENLKKGLLDKFISGISDFSRGYDENRNTAFSPSNLQARADINDFKANINPADYTTKLSDAEQKQFNAWANDMKAKGVINPNDNFQDYDMQGYWKNEVLNNTNLGNGNAQAHFTDKYKMPNHETFSNESIYAKGNNAKYAGKWDSNGNYVAPVSNNKMARLGEIAGTISRAAQKPAVQALLAGGLSTALTGNPLYGLGQAYKFGNARAMDSVYRDVLAQNGVNVPEAGFFGNLSPNDMRNIGNMAETRAWHEYLNKKNSEELAAKIAKNEADKEYKEQRAATMQQNAETNAYKAKNGTKVTHISTGGGKTATTRTGRTASNNGAGKNRAGFYSNLGKYRNLVNSGASQETINRAYQAMKAEYGNDFEKEAYKIKPTKTAKAAPQEESEEAFRNRVFKR